MTVHRISTGPDDPVWLSEHVYQVRWKGRLVTVDVRTLKPVRVSDELILASGFTAEKVLSKAIKGS